MRHRLAVSSLLKAMHASLSFHSRRSLAAFHSLNRGSPSLSRRGLDHLDKRCQTYLRPSSTRQISTDLTNNIGWNQNADREETLLDPYDILCNLQRQDSTETHTTVPLPKYLSPSSLDTFQKCPQAFFFKYILKLTADPPTTPALTRGTCCHTALEELFDLKPVERSLDNLKNLFRRAWKKKRGDRDTFYTSDSDVGGDNGTQKSNDCDCLFRSPDGQYYDIEAEREWGKTSLDLLQNYYELEDPRSIAPPNPIMREMWVYASFDVDNEPFVVRGIIDRIDIYVDEQSGKVQLQIIDYKTGKKPNFKYSQPVNERIEKEQFFSMRLYALILWKMILETEKYAQSNIDPDEIGLNGEDVKPEYKYRLSWELQQKLLRSLGKDGESNKVNNWSDMLEFLPLRLFYLTSHLDDESTNNPGKASYLDADPKPNFHQIIHETEQGVRSICRDIKQLVDMQDPLAFKHCNSKFCDCHEMRSRFRYGSVWSSE